MSVERRRNVRTFARTARFLFGSFLVWWLLTGSTHTQEGLPAPSTDQLQETLHAHLRSESYADAVDVLRTWVKREPGNAALHNLLGTTLERAGHSDRSPASYLRALQLNPSWSGVRLNLALNYLRLNQRQAAAGQFTRLVRSTAPPSLFPSYYNQAPVSDELKRFAQTLGSDPGQYLSLGGVLLVHELPEAASTVFGVGVEKIPTSSLLQDALARALLKLKRFGEAETAFRKALAVDPNSEGSCLHTGYAQASQGKVAEAEVTYRECIRREPDDYAGPYFLGLLLLEGGADRNREVISLLQRALRLNPRSVNSRFLLGKAHAASGDLMLALAEFQAVVDAEPENEAALFHLGALQRKLAEGDEARRTLQRFQRLKAINRQRSRQPLLFSRSHVDSMETSKLVREVSTFFARFRRSLLEGDYQRIWGLLTASSQALYGDFQRFKSITSDASSRRSYRQRIENSQLQSGNVFSGRIFCRFVSSSGDALPPLVFVQQGSELKLDYAFDLGLAGLLSTAQPPPVSDRTKNTLQ